MPGNGLDYVYKGSTQALHRKKLFFCPMWWSLVSHRLFWGSKELGFVRNMTKIFVFCNR